MDSIAVTESLMTKRQSLESTVGPRAMTPNAHRRRQRTKVRAPKNLPPKKTTVTHQWETAEEKLQSGTMESCNDWLQEPYKTDSPTSNSVCSDYSLHGTCMVNTWQSWQLLHFFLWCHRWFKKQLHSVPLRLSVTSTKLLIFWLPNGAKVWTKTPSLTLFSEWWWHRW